MSDPIPENIRTYISEKLIDYGLEGWCTQEKATDLCQLILRIKAELVVEIGVFGGRSLIPMGLAMKFLGRGMVFGIDPWDTQAAIEGSHDPVNDDWWSKVDLNLIMDKAMDAIRDAGVRKFVSVIPMHAKDGRRHFRKLSIDLLHIDGCHSEEASTRDVEDWLPLVRHGGYIVFDDADWESTQKAVAMLDKHCEREGSIGGKCLVFRKTRR